MLDLNYVRKHREVVQKAIDDKGYKIDLGQILSLDQERKSLQQQVEALRQQRNTISEQIKSSKHDPTLIERAKSIKSELSTLEAQLTQKEKHFWQEFKRIPNPAFEDVPLGGEEDSVEIKKWGECKAEGVDHLDYAMSRDWIDFERGAKVAGAKFYYLKNELALLENALIQFAISKIKKYNFTYMTVPHMVSSAVLEGAGFAPRSSKQSDDYFIEGEDLAMIATAELPITGYHANEIIDEDDLPLFYAGLSSCYRKEAGTYGKHTRGLFRVHQFNKVEMYAFCLPEKSKTIHEHLLAIEEEIWQELNIPYHVVNIAAGDLGAPAAKKYDIEYWSPHDHKYREITSCSNCTDFQARNLNIRVRRKDGRLEVLHTLNGTAISLARAMLAVIENYAQPDGKLLVPTALRPYLDNKKEI